MTVPAHVMRLYGFKTREGNNMRQTETLKKVTLFLVVLLAGARGVFAADLELWNKAVQLYAWNKDWVPGSVAMTIEELDEKGELKSLTESQIRYKVNQKRELEPVVIFVIKDGKDVTDKNRQAGGQRRDSAMGMDESPFDPALQDKVTVKPTGEKKTIRGHSCTGFSFVLKQKKNSFLGTAWIEEGTGIPYAATITFDPLPPFVTRMNGEILFSYTDDSTWYPSDMNFEGEGSFLFIKRLFRSKMNFSDYFMFLKQ